MQCLRQLLLGLVLSCVMASAAVASTSGATIPVPNLTLQEYIRRVDLALRPVFSPLITQWVQERYGQAASAHIRFIAFQPKGTVHVHVDVEAPPRSCIFALFYEWRDGWKLVQVDNHSPSASGCD